MTEFTGAFGGEMPPFEEAVDWFIAKTAMTRAQFDQLAAAEKGKAFTAAYVHQADQLQRVYDACREAIEQGRTLAEFKKQVGEVLTQPWHRETVFRTNVLSAYGAGHWEQAQEIKYLRPYGRYSAVMDGRTRPTHAALHGLVYPLDHPFWKSYWPPWDYNCRCGAVTLSEWEVERDNLEVRRELRPDLPPPAKKFQSPAAGVSFSPDYGKYEPGLAEQLRETVANYG